jgi:acyl-CoA synthetase (AMP-forming)/AMP-acid ligase II
MRQGRKLFGVGPLRVIDPEGRPFLRWQVVRRAAGPGPWICSAYLATSRAAPSMPRAGSLHGRRGVLHPVRHLQITDRKKETSSSLGGEWISSPGPRGRGPAGIPRSPLAAVIAIPHEKWGERPLLIARSTRSLRPRRSRCRSSSKRQVAESSGFPRATRRDSSWSALPRNSGPSRERCQERTRCLRRLCSAST